MALQLISMKLNQQQLELVDRCIAAGDAADVPGLVRRALRESADGSAESVAPAAPAPVTDLSTLSSRRELLQRIVLEPGTGKALELMSGQLLRIEQIEGAQCVDFNAFNLHDYKEFMHTGRTRTVHGLNPGPGDFLWSAPPRERAMMFVLADTARCNDVMFPRCSANLYESVYGFHTHTNCHDIQAEAQREFGLTPDDVHDSFNLFMCTEVHDGRGHIHRQHSKAGDHVEFLALMDVLAVPNVCGADIMRTSNFALKPVKLEIYKASERDLAAVPPLRSYTTQRTPAQFRQSAIKVDRALRRDTSYVPQFANVPIREQAYDVALDAEERDLLAAANLDAYYGDDAGAALRDVLFSWWERRYIGR